MQDSRAKQLSEAGIDAAGIVRAIREAAAARPTQSDLVVHLVDGSHPDQGAQIAAVERILRELGYGDIPRLLV